MNLEEGLEVLVRDWIDLHEDGGTKLSVTEVVKKLGLEKALAVKEKMPPAQIADLLQRRLQQIPGALEIAEKFMAQFSTPGDLLEEMDLDCFVCDLETG
ncbi:MAG: hypothetical protein PHD01_12975 [Geobacteraceae bacterium]|nr:hypothetical protein [Geobacteraceae bacterium]